MTDALRYAFRSALIAEKKAINEPLYHEVPMLPIPNEIAGTIRTWIHEAEPTWWRDEKAYRYEDFRMVRLDNKEYGFVLGRNGPLTARYKCGWVESQRRFKMLLTTRRLLCS